MRLDCTDSINLKATVARRRRSSRSQLPVVGQVWFDERPFKRDPPSARRLAPLVLVRSRRWLDQRISDALAAERVSVVIARVVAVADLEAFVDVQVRSVGDRWTNVTAATSTRAD